MKAFYSRLKRYLLKTAMQYTPRRILVNRNYIDKLGRKPDLKNPQTFSDKLAWYILYYRDEKMRICTDKASVRDYIESIGMGYLLNKCYGVYDRFEDIDWDSLPQRFVMKHTLSGEGKGIIMVFDKNSLNLEKTKKTLHYWIDTCPIRRARAGLWIFENREAKILIEELLIDNENDDLPDYKFFCFNGRVYCSYLIRNSSTKPTGMTENLAYLTGIFTCYLFLMQTLTRSQSNRKSPQIMKKWWKSPKSSANLSLM